MLAMTAGAQACLSLALFAAYGAMSVALVLAVYFSYPLLVCAASIALGRERLTPIRAVALLLSLAGLLVVVLGRSGPGVHASAMGLALAAVAACCQATYLVASRNGFTRVPSTQAVTVILVGAAVVIWAVALPVDGSAGRLLSWVSDPAAWLAILFAGIVGAGLAKVWLLAWRSQGGRDPLERPHARGADHRRGARGGAPGPALRRAGAARWRCDPRWRHARAATGGGRPRIGHRPPNGL